MNKPLFNKVCIVGVGLVGGSLGMAIKKRKLAKLVIGVVRRRETAIQAVEKKAVDVATFDLKKGVCDANLVILCSPVSAIVRQMQAIRPYLNKKTSIRIGKPVSTQLYNLKSLTQLAHQVTQEITFLLNQD